MAKNKHEMTMDRAKKRLWRIHEVTAWILDNADNLPKDLYRMEVDEVVRFVPVNILEILVDLVRQDFANAITPMQLWRVLGEGEGYGQTDPPANE